MDFLQGIKNAGSVIKEELPKFLSEDQAEGFTGTVKALVPQDLTDLGLMLTTGGYGKAAKLGGAALAGMSYAPEAHAGYVPTLTKAMREFPWQKALPDNVVQMLRALRQQSAKTGNEFFYPGSGSELLTSGSPSKVDLPSHVVNNMRIQKPALQAHTHPGEGYLAIPSTADLQLNQATPATAGLVLKPSSNPEFALYGAKGLRPFKEAPLTEYSNWVAEHANDNRALNWAEEIGMTDSSLKNPYAPFQSWVQNNAMLMALRDLEHRGKATAMYNGSNIRLPDIDQSVPSGALVDEFYSNILR